MSRVLRFARTASGVAGLVLAAPLIAQDSTQPPPERSEARTNRDTADLGQPEDPAAKRGFIRRQVGRIDNPDKAPENARPLPQPAKPGERQGFIRRQVGRDVNPDARTGQPLKPPAPSPDTTPQPSQLPDTPPE